VATLPAGSASCVEGIGRARVEPSFVPGVIDRMEAVSDSDSIGAMRALADRLGRRVGGSTGTNLWACAILIEEMANAGETGAVVTLLCDGGERYAATYYDDAWLAAKGLEWREPAVRIAKLLG
jgi:cysteine synthase A